MLPRLQGRRNSGALWPTRLSRTRALRAQPLLLGNARDLIAHKSKKTSTPSRKATLLGFPDYGGPSLAALPGTKVEIESIAQLLKNSGYQLNVLTQGAATEAKLKAVKGPELLHIATHGYFLEDVAASALARSEALSTLRFSEGLGGDRFRAAAVL